VSKAKAIKAIEKRGALLVYPLNNRKLPLSIWSELYPRSKMRWEWDVDGDDRVARLWSLREELSRSHQVVYAKWFQGRATFFSFAVFTNMLAYLGSAQMAELALTPSSREVLDILISDSPLSTKQLKAAVGLEGRLNEPTYNRALKPLWQNLLLVGFGEFEDSSFPSLGIAATTTMFEDLWNESHTLNPQAAEQFLSEKLGTDNPFWIFARKLQRATHRVLDAAQP
jgi:hypothetical protein